MYLNDKAKFESTAKFWTETYARPEASRDEVFACMHGLVGLWMGCSRKGR